MKLITRAFLRVHCDKETWREQTKATGIFSQGMLDIFFDKHPQYSQRSIFSNLNLIKNGVSG